MSRPISELLPDILLEAPGVPSMVALQALSSTTRDFLTRSSAWTQWSAPIDLEADQFEVIIPNLLDDDDQKWQRVSRVAALQWIPTGRDLEFMTADQLQDLDPQWRTRTGPVPHAFTNEISDNGSVLVARLYPGAVAAVTGALRAKLVITTHTYAGISATEFDDQAVEIPEFLFHEYRDTLVRGTLSRLLRMGGRDWTDKRQAMEYQTWYEEELRAAKSAIDASFGEPGLTVDYGGY